MLKAKSQNDTSLTIIKIVVSVKLRTEEKGWSHTRKMKRGVGTQWENERKRIERRRDEERRDGEGKREGKREKNPRASSASGLLGTADSLRGYFKV